MRRNHVASTSLRRHVDVVYPLGYYVHVRLCNASLTLQENLICGNEFARANANMILMGGVLVGAIAIGVFADM